MTRIGIVGAGAIVVGVHLPVLMAYPDVRVQWIADANGNAAREAAASFGIPAWAVAGPPEDLPACDIVFLATPVYAREAYLREFARRRTPIFAEKPFALSAAEHEAYQALCGDVPVACGYMRRSYASSRLLRTIVRDGWLGALCRITYGEGGRVAKTGGGTGTLDRPAREGGGVLRDLGCHGIDLLCFLTDAGDFADVAADIVWDARTDRDVRSTFTLVGSGGSLRVPVAFDVSWIRETGSRLALEFERGVVSCGIGPGDLVTVESAAGATRLRADADDGAARTSYQAFYLEWRDFVESVTASRASAYAASTSLRTTRLVDAIYAAGGLP